MCKGDWIVILGTASIMVALAGATAFMDRDLANRRQDKQTAAIEQLIDKKLASLREELRAEMETPASPDMVYSPQTLAKQGSLAVRNKNPFNVKGLNNGDKWLGQCGSDKQGHAKFESWEHGVRAAALTLISYEKRYGIRTIRGIVTRFSQSNHEAYCNLLSKALGIGADEQFSIHKRMPDLLRAMCRMECGIDLPSTLLIPYTTLEKL